MKKYLAELCGTFTLSLLVYLSLSGQFPISTPILAALCLTVFVYTIGGISGAHINPAVTIGLLTLGKIKLDEAVKYIIFQFFGAVLAIWLFNYLHVTVLSPVIPGGVETFFAETLGTALLTFGISSVAFGTAPGFIVGGSLLLGISVSALIGSAGILNPAVALTLGAFYSTYVLGQLAGSIAGFYLYRYLSQPVTTRKKVESNGNSSSNNHSRPN